MESMLYHITDYINNYMLGYNTLESFWSDISAEAVEEFLSNYEIPVKFHMPKSGDYDYSLFKELEEHIISVDDSQEHHPVLDTLDAKVATGVVLFKIYTNFINIT